MIKHFLVYDIKQNKFLLFFLYSYTALICSLVLIFNKQFVADTFGVLMVSLLVLGSIPSSAIIGANFRSQQTISRKFLLSLPVKRINLLLINIVRGMFFHLPLFMLIIFFSFLDVIPHKSFLLSYFEFVLVILLISIWIVLVGFHYSISFEKVSKHQNKILRTVKMIWSFAQLFFDGTIVFLLFANDGGFGISDTMFLLPVFIKVAILLALIVNRFFWTKRLWLNQ